MTDATQLLQRIQRGDGTAAAELLPLIYDELRRLATVWLQREAPGQSLQPTALVHEAWLRLNDGQGQNHWDHRGHFFAAAAEAMRRILIEQYRRKQAEKRGGHMMRRDVNKMDIETPGPTEDLEALDEALSRLEMAHPRQAELVKLRYFAGLTTKEVAEFLQISPATADRDWAYARAWLLRELQS